MHKCMRIKKSGMNRSAFVKFIRFLPFIIRKMPGLLSIFVLFSLCHSISWCVIIIANERLVDALTIFKDNEEASYIIKMLIIFGLIHVVKQLFNALANYVPIIIKGKLNRELELAFFIKMKDYGAIDYENPAFLDTVEKVENGKKEIVWEVITLCNILFFYIPYFVFTGVYLSQISPIFVLGIVVAFLPAVFTLFVRSNLFTKQEDKVAPLRRKYTYYEKCIVDRDYFKETRHSGMYQFFYTKYQKYLRKTSGVKENVEIKVSMIELLAKFLGLIGYTFIIVSLIILTGNGTITVGAFAAVFQGITDIYKLMEELIFGHVSGMTRDIGKVNNYIDFIMQENAEERTVVPEEVTSIRFENVSFQYNDKDGYVLKDVNVEINKGETIAIVGMNGSGKTTFSKLLLGLYSPTRGNVIYNDIYKNKYFLSEKTSAMFQNYNKYKMTLRENVSISDLAKNNIETKSVESALNTAGVKVDATIFPQKYDTLLAKEFSGTDLSGGQWQRIAIARTVFRNAELIVMDEPTSAIDPMEETYLYEKFEEIAKDKTSIIITHRLGLAKIAQRILVFDKGALIADGTHDHLIETSEVYRNLYMQQKEWYK